MCRNGSVIALIEIQFMVQSSGIITSPAIFDAFRKSQLLGSSLNFSVPNLKIYGKFFLSNVTYKH